uniref:Uncharacterized protein n=1 Tax=Alexandrium monilatum TaxID=311494 RepID=A0A7S4RC26_9DINO
MPFSALSLNRILRFFSRASASRALSLFLAMRASRVASRTRLRWLRWDSRTRKAAAASSARSASATTKPKSRPAGSCPARSGGRDGTPKRLLVRYEGEELLAEEQREALYRLPPLLRQLCRQHRMEPPEGAEQQGPRSLALRVPLLRRQPGSQRLPSWVSLLLLLLLLLRRRTGTKIV